MKMTKPTKPSPEEFKLFADQILAEGSRGISGSVLFQRNATMRRWLEHILDYLPFDLGKHGIACYSSGRGVWYQLDNGKPENYVPPQPKAPTKAKSNPNQPDSKDWAANTRLVPPAEWKALADIIRAGDVTFQALLGEHKGTAIARACLHHPEGVPEPLAKHGVVLLRNGDGAAANFGGTYTIL